MAETLDAQQASIGGVTQLFELIKVVQQSADVEVVAVVDGGLGAQRAAFLVILLDARVLVVDVQRGHYVLANHARAKARRRALVDAPAEDQLHLVRTAQVEILADHVFEECASVQRAVEHLGEGELGLQDRHLVEHAGTPVGTAERVRQPPQPLAQQRIDARSK